MNKEQESSLITEFLPKILAGKGNNYYSVQLNTDALKKYGLNQGDFLVLDPEVDYVMNDFVALVDNQGVGLAVAKCLCSIGDIVIFDIGTAEPIIRMLPLTDIVVVATVVSVHTHLVSKERQVKNV